MTSAPIFVLVVIALGAHLAAVETAEIPKTCGPGKYLTSTGCKLCPLRTFSNTRSAATECQQCPNDTYTLRRGVTSRRLCFRCPSKFTSNQSTPKCSPCPTNHIGKCGRCVNCPPGTYINDYRNCTCEKCSSNEFTSTSNKLRCEQCPTGLIATSSGTSCKSPGCAPGYSYDGYECLPCEYNTFRNGNMSTCEECPTRTVTGTFTAGSKCYKCPPGQYITDYAPQGSTYEQTPLCFSCPPNSTTIGYSKPLCRASRGKCPPNSFVDRQEDCQVCPYNHRVNLKTRRCVPCPDGYAAYSGAMETCIKCPDGATGGLFGRCECKEGYMSHNGQCIPCPIGTSTDAGADYGCNPCADGYIAPREGMTRCLKCPKGLGIVDTNRTRCTAIPKCPTGYIYRKPLNLYYAQATCVSTQSGCFPGTRPVIRRGKVLCVNSKGEVVCPPGSLFDKDNMCISCGPMYYAVKAKGSPRRTCQRCPNGSYSFGGNATSCTHCPSGFSILEGLPEDFICTCPSGNYIQSDNGACVRCPLGTESDPSDPHKCQPCTKGFSLTSRYDRYCGCKRPNVINGTGFCVPDDSPMLNYEH